MNKLPFAFACPLSTTFASLLTPFPFLFHLLFSTSCHPLLALFPFYPFGISHPYYRLTTTAESCTYSYRVFSQLFFNLLLLLPTDQQLCHCSFQRYLPSVLRSKHRFFNQRPLIQPALNHTRRNSDRSFIHKGRPQTFPLCSLLAILGAAMVKVGYLEMSTTEGRTIFRFWRCQQNHAQRSTSTFFYSQ